MVNRAANIKQADVTRLIKGAQAAGFSVGRIEVEGGKIVIYGNKSSHETATSPLERWRRENGADR